LKKPKNAEEEFDRIFKKKDIPDDMPEFKFEETELRNIGLNSKSKLCELQIVKLDD
jgi:hypothetical protein